MTVLRKLLLSLATLLLLSIVPVACVNQPQTKADADHTIQVPPVNSELESRVLGRWDALMEQNFDQAYEFFSPAYRKLFPLEHYLKTTGSSVNWLSVKIKDIQFDDKRAKVKLVLEFQLVFPMGAGEDFGQISKDIGEVWLWIDGAWWYTTDDDGTLL